MPNRHIQEKKAGILPLHWLLIAFFFLITASSGFIYSPATKDMIPIVFVISLFIAVCLHGIARYGLKHLIVFFLITWIVSHFFEALSIQTGFPFGHYFYDQLVGPRLFQVPLIIMPAYFSMGYVSWILSNILLEQYGHKLVGKQIFYIPFIAAFIMVIWDVCMDPIASTIASLWAWKEGGSYYGVPMQNYFGWFLVVYLLFQIFALFIAKYEKDNSNNLLFSSKFFWLEAVALYGIQALNQLLNPITQNHHMDIYAPMAMITIFTMVFVVCLSWITLQKNQILQ
jgi:putative membrane protein